MYNWVYPFVYLTIQHVYPTHTIVSILLISPPTFFITVQFFFPYIHILTCIPVFLTSLNIIGIVLYIFAEQWYFFHIRVFSLLCLLVLLVLKVMAATLIFVWRLIKPVFCCLQVLYSFFCAHFVLILRWILIKLFGSVFCQLYKLVF